MRCTGKGKSPSRGRAAPLTGMALTAALALSVLGALSALSGCTAGGSSSDAAGDSKSVQPGETTASPLPPGKYRTLPQPCTAIDADTLKALVPDAKDYAGKEALTYDTDRRVGCAWQGRTPGGVSSSLVIDFERVVSYDPGISDEAQAEADFDQRATAASVSLIPPSTTSTTPTTPTTPASPTGGAGSAGAGGGAGGSKGADSGPHSGSTAGVGTDPALQPRVLGNIGDLAFINDVLKTPASGPRRQVTLVFRTANVVVSVTYTVAEPRGATPAQSADLQKDAQQVASKLEHKVEK